MRKSSLVAALVAALHLVILSSPARALQPAQPAPAAPAPSAPVQPVPYATSQPVQYGTAPAPTPGPTAPAPQYAGVGVGSDIVVLKNGGMIRGTLVELLPNDHATVQLPSGQSAIIQWTEIHHIERGAAPTPSGTPTPAPVLAPTPTAAKMTGPTVLVHIDSPKHKIILSRRNPGEGEWMNACVSPCDVQMPLNNDYRIVGSGVTGSGEFNLEGAAGQRVIIKINAGTTFGLTAGLATAASGLLVVIVGLYVVAGAAAVNATSNLSSCLNGSLSSTSSSCRESDSSSGTTAGLVITGLGLAAIGVGGVIAIINWRTGQSQEVQSPRQGMLSNDAWKRAPMWREASVLDRGPSATMTPLFTTSF